MFGSVWVIGLFFQFHECWWDSLIIDLLGANLIGMTLGLYTLRFLETRTFDWNSKERSTKFAKSLVSHQPRGDTQAPRSDFALGARGCPGPGTYPTGCHTRDASRWRHVCEGMSSGGFCGYTLACLRYNLECVRRSLLVFLSLERVRMRQAYWRVVLRCSCCGVVH